MAFSRNLKRTQTEIIYNWNMYRRLVMPLFCQKSLPSLQETTWSQHSRRTGRLPFFSALCFVRKTPNVTLLHYLRFSKKIVEIMGESFYVLVQNCCGAYPMIIRLGHWPFVFQSKIREMSTGDITRSRGLVSSINYDGMTINLPATREAALCWWHLLLCIRVD